MSRVQHVACKTGIWAVAVLLFVVGVFAIVRLNEGCTTLASVCEVQP